MHGLYVQTLVEYDEVTLFVISHFDWMLLDWSLLRVYLGISVFWRSPGGCYLAVFIYSKKFQSDSRELGYSLYEGNCKFCCFTKLLSSFHLSREPLLVVNKGWTLFSSVLFFWFKYIFEFSIHIWNDFYVVMRNSFC